MTCLVLDSWITEKKLSLNVIAKNRALARKEAEVKVSYSEIYSILRLLKNV